MFKKAFREFVSTFNSPETDNPQYVNDIEAAADGESFNERGEKVDGLVFNESEMHLATEKKSLFLETLQEKRKIHQDKVHEFTQEVKQFDEAANVKKAEVKMELENDFDNFFQRATQIVKQTRGMEEAQMLERLGLEQEDKFDGNFNFKDIKNGARTMNDVSGIFKPRREPGTVSYHIRDDEYDQTCGCLSRSLPQVNYDPLTEKEFHHLQRHYVGLSKLFARHNAQQDMTMDVSDTWLDNEVSMKLLAEFIWRHTDAITAFDAEKAKGFTKRHCLMVMQALKECRGLTTLDFDNTEMCKEGSAAVALIAKVSTNLQAISLVKTSTTDAGAAFWGLALATGCPSLTSLDLSDCKIGASGATSLAIGLSEHKSLRILNLSNNRVDRPGCQRLGEALLANPVLEELNLSGNSIGSRGASSIAAFIIHPRCQLKTLVLTNNDIGPRGGRALALGMSYNKSIVTLEMSQNDLGDIGAAGFGRCLEMNSTMRLFNISDCDITDLGATGLSFGLKKNVGLRVLKAASQVIGDAGCANMARMLSENPDSRLHVLDFSTNTIRDTGALALAEMLKHNTSLHELILADNEIQDEGARAMGQVLGDQLNRTLKVLDVSENPISAEVSLHFFAKAEHRLITQSTQRLDVLAQGTSMARGNLRGCGVIVLRSEMPKYYAIFLFIVSLIGGWAGLASNLLVAYNTVMAAYTNPTTGGQIYAALTCIFIILPFLYLVVVFSLPEDESDITVEGDEEDSEAGTGKKNTKKHLLESSSLMLGKAFPMGEGTSFTDHLREVSSRGCTPGRLKLLFLNVTYTRIPYEIYLSYKTGMTTLALSSIRLSNMMFGSIPQSIIQLHILFSSVIITKIHQGGLVIYVGTNSDFSALVLVVSVAFSVSVLSSTLSGLYEEKFMTNWKRVAMANEDLAYAIAYVACYVYHFTHYLFRALTITWIASMYGALLAVGFYLFGCLLRLGILVVTKSQRRKLFAIVSYLVGAASWDTRLAARLAVICELLETLIVIVPVWLPLDQIQADFNSAPLAFQTNWYALVTIIGPVVFTALLYGCAGVSLLLYIFFIERIHPYRDVHKVIDLGVARDMADSPFSEQASNTRKRRRDQLTHRGKAMFASLSSSLHETTLKASAKASKSMSFLSRSEASRGVYQE